MLDALHITTDGKIMNTPPAVIGGLTYSFMPFALLPIYVSLEKVDINVVDAASDLYASFGRAFRKVILPLSLPGVFAGTLLVFIPASGDFINNELLGNAAREPGDRRRRSRPASSTPATSRRRRRSASC